MKKSEIVQFLSTALKVKNFDSVNEALKDRKLQRKFRMTGRGFRQGGFTGEIKALTEEGVKIYNVNRVNLVRYDEIESIGDPKPREEKKEMAAKPLSPKPAPQKSKSRVEKLEEEDDEDYENDDDFDPYADEDDDVIEDEKFKEEYLTKKQDDKKIRKKQLLNKPGSGSLFIPKPSKSPKKKK